MATNVLKNYNLNPYASDKKPQSVVIYTATGYHANLLVILSPIAIRVMLVLASKLNNEGYAISTLDELADCIQTPRSYVNKGILLLEKKNLIRKKQKGQYWINPSAFRPATIVV